MTNNRLLFSLLEGLGSRQYGSLRVFCASPVSPVSAGELQSEGPVWGMGRGPESVPRPQLPLWDPGRWTARWGGAFLPPSPLHPGLFIILEESSLTNGCL